MNILVPIAGKSAQEDDTQYIKSLYEIQNKLVIQHIYESLNKIGAVKFIFVVCKADVQQYHLDNTLRLLAPDAHIVVAEGGTQGSACSCLLAVDEIDNNTPLLISGADQIVTENWNVILEKFKRENDDAGVVCFDAIHPKWSFVRVNEADFVTEAAEKRPISRDATTGQYYFKHGKDFVRAAQQMIQKGASVKGQYYVCPALNELILEQKKIGVYRIARDKYFSLKDQRGMDAYQMYLEEEV